MDIFKEAFCMAIEQTLGETPKECKEPLAEGFISSISVKQDNECFVLYLVSSLPFLQHLAYGLLMEDDPQEDTLVDLSREISNLVAGVAKAKASDQSLAFKMATPEFVGVSEFKFKYKEQCTFSCLENQKCTIYRGE